MSEMATAYVQIIPSAKGITGSIKNVLNPEAESAGRESGQTLGNSLVSSIKGIIVAAGLGTIIKESLSAGGDLQQSFGGLETIYGDAAKSAKQFATEASAFGLSMNDYAEQAVSFGASLKQAFGGDTVKAAEAANTAIKDMADNSAKMGTDINSVQAAYQGFAKQNYTMLDNLKLGYGGTKTEMERLLADAEKLSGVKYDINNLGDVYNAIHVIQGELGLTGVAAAEASTTFTGSLGAMKAAGTNLLATMATGGDVTAAFATLGQTVQTFVLNNLFPMIGSLISSLPALLSGASQMLSEIVPQLITTLTQAVVTNLPMLLDTATQLLVGLVNGIISVAPMLLESAITIINTLSQYVMENLPMLLELGLNLLMELAMGILNNLPMLINTATEIINSLLNYILTHLPEIMQMGMEILLKLIEGIVTNFPAIVIAIADLFITLGETIITHLPEILQKGIEIIGELVTGIINALPKVAEGIKTVADHIKNTLEEKFETFKEAGSRIIDGIKEGIVNAAHKVIDAVKDVAKKAYDAVTEFFDINSPSRLMRDKVGKMIDLGLASGIENYGIVAVKAATNVGKNVFEAMNNPLDANITASRSATINLNVVGEVNGKAFLELVNNGLGVQL